MRFHTTAVIHAYDSAGVRRALLDRLRDLTLDIETSGGLIMLSGIGPGSVSMNKDDFAILTIEEQPDAVFIEMDGVFDGDYLEDHAAQESAVCTKMDRIFESVQSQIELEQWGSKEKPIAAELTSVPDVVQRREVMPVASALAAAVRMSRRDSSGDSGPSGSDVSAVRPAVPMSCAAGFVPAGLRRFGLVAAGIAGLVVIAAGFVGVQRYMHTQKSGDSRVVNSAAGAQGNGKSGGGLGAVASVANQPQGSRAEGKKEEHDGQIPSTSKAAQLQADYADPTTLLKHWEAAMRTRDAAQQSSFYTDPVDRYEGVTGVNLATLEQKKQAAIANRKGLWTVKLERIEIKKRTADEAQISVIQHVIDQPAPSRISEEFVRTELRLRRVNAGWKIVSEEDVAESPDPLGPRS